MRSLVAFALLALAACGGVRLAPPPAVFPITTLWNLPLEAATEGPLASDGSSFLVLDRNGRVLALDPDSGSVRWRWQKRPGRLVAARGLAVLLEPDGVAWGLDPATGERLWKSETGVAGELVPVVSGDRVFVAGDRTVALDARSGAQVWRRDALAASAPPTAAGERLLVPGADGALHCLDRATGATLWYRNLGTPLRASVAIDERQRVYVGTTQRRIVALRLDDPAGQDWSWQVGTDVVEAPIVAGERVVVVTLENVVYGLDRRHGSMAWRAALPSRAVSGPVRLGSAVLVACHERDVVALDARDGSRLGAFQAPGALRAGPVLAGGRVALGLRNPWAVAGLRLAFAAPPDASGGEPPQP